jgi:tripartite-type tricarboxylate transporter receptor subunit TctC
MSMPRNQTRAAPWARRATGVLVAAALAGAVTAASAQEGAFRSGEQVSLYIGYEAGSSYDIYARLVADHISRFLPGNPVIIPKNLEGAGSMRVMNYLYEVAPRDGTAWGAPSRDVPFEPLLYGKASKAAFKDPLEMKWFGSLNTEIGVAAVWHTTGVKTWAEAKGKPIIVAMASANGGISARAVNKLLHANFQQVCCYGADSNQNLAMERGEVEGRIGWSWSSVKATKPDWLRDKKINLLMQIGLQKNPDIPGDVPLILDLAESPQDKAALKIIFSGLSMGRPFVMPPGVPPARLALVREGFMKMVKDPEFLAAAQKHKLEINDPKSGEEIERILKDAYTSPEDVIASARETIEFGEIKMVK